MTTLSRAFSAALVSLFLYAGVAAAAPIELKVLFDEDNDASTGCVVNGFAGVEHVLLTRVETSDPARVTSAATQSCSGSTFGAVTTIDAAGWPAAFNAASGALTVESQLDRSFFGPGPRFGFRVGFVAESATSLNTLFSDVRGNAIRFPVAKSRRRLASIAGPNRVITLDGLTADWVGIGPLASGSGAPDLRFVEVYGYFDQDALYFRFEAQANEEAPTAVDDAYQTDLGTALTVAAPGVLANDTDPLGRPLSATLVSPTVHGSVVLNSDGSFTYANDGTGVVDEFAYRASNGVQSSNIARAEITIGAGANTAPVGVADTYQAGQGEILEVSAPGVLQNDTDTDGDTLTARLGTPPVNGTITLNANGSFTYQNGGVSGADTFTYFANDGLADSSAVTVTINVVANVPPTATPNTYTVAEGGTLNVPAPGPLANDIDPDTPTEFLSIVASSLPAHGTLSIGANGQFTYVHNGSNTTADSFGYRARDDFSTSNAATITIIITPVNDLPVAVNDAYSTNEDTPLTVTAPGVLGNDTDSEGSAITATLVTNGTGGSVVLNADGSFTYTPNADFNGTDTFTYSANDGTVPSAPATVTITVTAVNDPPVFTAGGNVTVNEDSGVFTAPWATGVSAGPADEAGQLLNFTVTNDNTALFAVQPSIAPNGTLTFTPAADANGSTIVSVTLIDNGSNVAPNANSTGPITFAINVTAVNDPPSFILGPNQSVAEDSGAQTVFPFAHGMSPGPSDEAGQTVAFNVTNNNNALFSVQPAIAPNGQLTYTPAANATGVATVTVTAADSGGATSTGQTFTITITAENDAPVNTVPGDQTIPEDGTVVFTGGTPISIADVDAGTGSIQVVAGSTNGTLAAAPLSGATVTNDGTASVTITGTITQVNAALDGLTFTPALNFAGTAVVTITSNDQGNTGAGGALLDIDTVSILVNAVNDAPSFTPGGDVTVLEDSSAYSAQWATSPSAGPADEAGQALTFLVTNDNNSLFNPQPGIASDGTLTFTVAANAFGSATVTVALQDDGGTTGGGVDTSASVTFTITVTAVNDAPSFTAGADVTVNEDSAAYSAAWATAVSAGPSETQTLTFAVSNDNGPLFSVAPAIAADGTLTFTPAANASGSATVTVSLSDDGGTANGGADSFGPTTFQITVNAVNDAPSFTAGGDVTVLEDSSAYSAAWATAISAGPANESGQALTFNVSNDNSALFSAQPSIAADGTLSFTVSANAFGSATVTVALQDDGGTANGGAETSPSITFTITVTPVNDVPAFASGGDVTVLEDAAAYNAAWATGISAGSGETQNLTFFVSNDANALFLTQPSISSTGVLTFQANPNLNGSATVSVYLQDDGGTANSGVDTSATITFTLTITAVNDAPSFTGAGNVTVNENTGAYSAAWASAILAGPANESGQIVTFGTTNANNALFSVQPSIASDGTLTFTPATNAFGTALVTVTLTDNGGTANGGVDAFQQTLTITVNEINSAPTFTPGADVTVNEDGGGYSAIWATSVDAGPGEGTQVLTFTVVADNTALFAAQPAIAADGTLTFIPASDASGSATISVILSDNGGIANGGDDTADEVFFTITVNASNDAPSFTTGGDVTVNEDSVAYSAAWATAISAGPADEAGQALTFNVSNDNSALFSVQPAIATDGTLTFTPAADAFGSTIVTVTLSDDGGTANGGADTSAAITFTLTINGVNDEPSFTGGGNVSVNEDSAAYDAAWATAISAGPSNESGQSLTFNVSNDNTALFSAQPAVSATGQLTFTLNANAYGATTVSVFLTDNGGTANSGDNTSATVTFTITVNPVNDPPTATAKTHVTHSGIGLTISAASHTGELKEGADDVDDHDPFSELTVQIVTGTLTPVGSTLTLIDATDGSFYFEPRGGVSGNGSGSFQFQVCDNGDVGLGLAAACSTATTVTFNITGPDLWFVDDTDAAGCGVTCNGARTKPLVGLNNANANFAGRGTGDTIFAFSGTYNHGHTMAASEQLVGQASSGVFDTVLSVSVPGNGTLDTRPSLSGAAATLQNTLTAADTTTVRGITLSTGANKGYVATAANLTVLESSVVAGNTAVELTNATTSSINFVSTTSTGGTHGINLSNVSGTFSFGTGGPLATDGLKNHTTAGFRLVNAGAGINASSISYAGVIEPGAGRAVSIGTTDGNAGVNASNGMEAGTNITFSGNMTGGGVAVYESVGGTLNLNGNLTFSTGVTTAFDLIDNDGATINLPGVVAVSTTTGTGLNATDGGTVNITGNSNTISILISGRAVNVAGTSSAAKMAGTLRFRTINKAAGGSKGIVVNNTTGSFTVTGDGNGDNVPDSITAGGTITGTTQRGAEFVAVDGGVYLGGMTFTNTVGFDGGSEAVCGTDLIGNDNTICNAAIHLQSLNASTTLRTILVNGSSQTGINGFSVRALTLNGVTVQNAGSPGSAEHGVTLKNLLGANVITGSTFTANAGRGLYVINTASESPQPTLSVTSSTFSNSGSLQGALFDSYNSGDYTVNVGDDTAGGANTFSGNFSNALQQSVGLGGDMTINIKRNTFNHTVSGIVLQAAGVGATSNLNYSIWNNAVVKTNGTTANGSGAIIISGTQQHQISGDIRGNTIGNGALGSGAFCGGGCNGITVDHNDISAGGGGRHDATIVGNDIRNVDSSAIRVVIGQKSRGNVTITGNRIRDPHVGASTTFSGIYVQGGIVLADPSCLTATIGGTFNPGGWPSSSANAMNSIEGSWDPMGSQSEIFVWRKGGTLNIPGGGAPFDAFIAARNSIPDATGADVTTVGALSSGLSCP
jgi:VCBS repeat-containing protein